MPLMDSSQIAILSKRFSRIQFWRELLTAIRFGLVGIVATAAHMLVIWLLLRKTEASPVAANTLAFLVAFGISFAGNYLWTFQSPGSPCRALRRFFSIALSAFLVNTLLLVFLVSGEWFTPVTSAILSASVVPVISFGASRLWGFKRKEGII